MIEHTHTQHLFISCFAIILCWKHQIYLLNYSGF